MPGDVLPMEPIKKFEYANNHEYFEVVDRYFAILDIEYNSTMSSLMFLNYSTIIIKFMRYTLWLVFASYISDIIMYEGEFFILKALISFLDVRIVFLLVMSLLLQLLGSYAENIKIKINQRNDILNTTIKYIWLLYQTSDGHVSEAARESIRLRLSRYDFIKARQG